MWPTSAFAGAFRGSLALIAAHRGRFGDARALLAQGESQVPEFYAEEHIKILCKRGTIEVMAAEIQAARAALEKASSIANRIHSNPESGEAKAVAELRELLGTQPTQEP